MGSRDPLTRQKAIGVLLLSSALLFVVFATGALNLGRGNGELPTLDESTSRGNGQVAGVLRSSRTGSAPPRSTPCVKTSEFCGHAGAHLDSSRDCDGDWILDHFCTAGSESGWLSSKYGCRSTWPNGRCGEAAFDPSVPWHQIVSKYKRQCDLDSSCGKPDVGDSNGNSLALHESFDFFDEMDLAWKKRKKKHLNQMCVQGLALESASCSGARDCDLNPWTLYQKYFEPTFACPLEERIGNFGDGGKWVCDPMKLSARVAAGGSCLVYSIGSEGNYGFEQSVHDSISDGCEIHTVDRAPWNTYTHVQPPAFMNYHVYTVGGEPPATDVPTIIKDLGHANRTIDIFKIDCESCEWSTYKHWFGAGVNIRQILMEVHGTGQGKVYEFFDYLFDLGYVIFHKEPNIEFPNGGGVWALEFALLKLRPAFACVDQ